MKKLLLIDGMSTAYRAFYAIRGLATSRGQPSNAVFGFVRMLKKLLKEYRPDYVAIAADSRAPTFRHEKFKEYKATRKPLPEDLASQLPLIRRVAEGYRIPWLALPGFEADDILATLALQAEGEGLETFILTGDKDLLQLVGKRIKVISPHRDGTLYDEKAVKDGYGVAPDRIPDILALMGDGIDNIPGVPGVGEKTAIKLIQEYQTLEEVLRRAPEVKNRRVRENLMKFSDQARFSQELVKLDTQVPLTVEWKDLEVKPPAWEQLRDLFGEMEFRQLLEELPPEEGERVACEILTTPEQIRERLTGFSELALQVRTGEGDFMSVRPSALGISFEKGKGVLVPLVSGPERENLGKAIQPFLEAENVKKYVHDAKRLSHVFLNEGITLKGVDWDSLLVSYLLNPSRPEHSLESVVREYLGWSLSPTPGETGDQETASAASLCGQASAIRGLKEKLGPEIEEKQLATLLKDMELPLSKVLMKMERNGIALDCPRLNEMSKRLARDLEALTREMYEVAGEEFNLNSPKQLAQVLFEKLKLPRLKKTKTGYSTDVGVLQKLAVHHDLPQKILAYRQLFKLKSTYVDALPGLVNPLTGRLHTTFHQDVTATGRLSSSDPNLQNIPIRTELGTEIRAAFVPSPAEWKFFSADYSQIDLRVLAHLSGDPLLLEAFTRDQDIHAFTASQIFAVPIAEVTGEMRRKAKTVNFGIIYGMGPYGLAEALGISQEEAKAFISAYFERYRGVDSYIQTMVAEAKRKGYVTTIFNRRRYLPELRSDQDNVRRFGERTAVNTPIQGSAADIIKLAMIEIDRRLARTGLQARMLLQIHDELLFEAPAGELDPLGALVRSCMEGVIRLKVRLKTDVKIGSNWGEL